MVELSRGAIEDCEKERLAFAISETRAAVVVVSAALRHLHAKLDEAATGDIALRDQAPCSISLCKGDSRRGTSGILRLDDLPIQSS